MTSLTDIATEGMIRAQMQLGIVPSVDQPTANFNGPGVEALKAIANVVLALVIVASVIGILLSVGAIILGHTTRNEHLHKNGITGLLWCILGVAVAGSAAGLVNFGQSLPVA